MKTARCYKSFYLNHVKHQFGSLTGSQLNLCCTLYSFYIKTNYYKPIVYKITINNIFVPYFGAVAGLQLVSSVCITSNLN